ncbi:dienelactone hydrolase family protein [Thermoactinospora rubra]|uniref:dienelactone hydrolase family protein n=1 Tax=Thermoactinospora rubra TaxID=1088767 RepID=UPI000A102621|nr:hypothetical protein [Thermoactinospora rubra]
MTGIPRGLGAFAGLVDIATRQRGLFPDPGPAFREQAREAIGVLDLQATGVKVERTWTDGDLAGEELSWSVGFGPRTRAYLLRPRDHAGPLPGVVALHCHSGMKWHGKEKIADGPEPPSPEVRGLRERIYGGRAYANALARRGFAVLAHDVFAWGSRRFEPIAPTTPGAYDEAASAHEYVLAKYCTLLGTSFAGVVAAEDLAAAAYLRSRPDVTSVACLGLSGGGLRAAMLGAFDPRITAVVVAAMLSSSRDMLDGHVENHTWMLYPPGLSRLGDWPDLAAARAPAPLMVQYATGDHLFPESGMRRAHGRVAEHYRDAPGAYEGVFVDAPHSFTVPMQERAFDWLARWL